MSKKIPECVLKGAWLISWESCFKNEKEKFKEMGIRNKIIDIIDSHKDFDWVKNYVMNLYISLNAGYCEKMYLAGRKGELKKLEKRQKYFKSQPLFTHYKTDLYIKYDKALKRDSRGSKFEKLHEGLIKMPKYISIGHNPNILARKAKDLKVYATKQNVIIEWKEKSHDNGKWVLKNYKN